MNSRRKFLANAGMLGLGIPALRSLRPFHDIAVSDSKIDDTNKANKPVVISTWSFGVQANVAAWEILGMRGYALDAVEAAAKVVEADPSNQSVGYGGLPDRDGHVTLDACIMDEQGNAGSVTYLENIMHPASVARRVMELTPHVMLSGRGALNFALQQGFEKQDLLTDQSRAAWEAWKIKAQYEPIINIENHDTIGILALDQEGRLSGTCTTSGLAFKMNGRVGDSPIIGAGLFVDGEVGGAVATGLGEFVMKTLGSFLVVEFMRRGKSPQMAVEEAIERIVHRYPNYKTFQVGYLALNLDGQHGAYAIQPGFNYAKHDALGGVLADAKSYI